MTTGALRSGFDILRACWPGRFADQGDLTRTMAAYAAALGDLSDEAWLGACRAALRTCRFFPVPAELLELAEAAAEEAQRGRLRAMEDARLRSAIMDGQRLLAAGVLTEEMAAANRERYAAMAAETLAAIKAGGEKVRAERRAEFWTGRAGRRRRGGES